jgi:hypothetical protein
MFTNEAYHIGGFFLQGLELNIEKAVDSRGVAEFAEKFKHIQVAKLLPIRGRLFLLNLTRTNLRLRWQNNPLSMRERARERGQRCLIGHCCHLILPSATLSFRPQRVLREKEKTLPADYRSVFSIGLDGHSGN